MKAARMIKIQTINQPIYHTHVFSEFAQQESTKKGTTTTTIRKQKAHLGARVQRRRKQLVDLTRK
jgi:hypothetical protein